VKKHSVHDSIHDLPKHVIAHCPNNPVVIPMYHRGMHQVVPEKRLALSDASTPLLADSSMQLSTSPPAVTSVINPPPTKHSLFSTMEQSMKQAPLSLEEEEDLTQKLLAARRRRRRRVIPSSPVSVVPIRGSHIEVLFGEPLDFSAEVSSFRREHPGLLDGWAASLPTICLYERITLRIEEALLQLEAEAYGK